MIVARATGCEARHTNSSTIEENENLRLVMHRNGFPEETWYSFSYSPLRGDRDEVVGLFCACTETTPQVLAGRRLAAERERLFELSRDLGLSQVHGMTRQAGGAVRIESLPSVGTSIALLFRRAELPDRRALEAPGDAEARLAARTILLVDDDPDVRQVLADELQSLGLEVTTAADGLQAIARLETTRPDVLLHDFAMPGMNGAEVARIACGLYPALPIVFATGDSEAARSKRAPCRDQRSSGAGSRVPIEAGCRR